MALKSTIFKVKLSLSNMNIHHYDDYSLTVARHPSENNLRMMSRILAFSLGAQDNLQFTKGISSDSEPDLWNINHDGSIEHWIELGHLDERRIRQACAKARHVLIYTYQDNQSLQWFESIKNGLTRFSNLGIIHFNLPKDINLDDFVERGMNFSISIEDNELWLSSGEERFLVELIKQI